VGADTVGFIYSGSRLVAEYTDAGAQLRRYSYLPGMDNPHAVYENGSYHYYVTDGRGNVRALVNSTGNTVQAEYRYTPFGDTVSTSGSLPNPVRFAGREFDSETGLYYNRARYYDPQLGRFVSEDGGGLSPVNRYTYAGNDPVNGRDPTGGWCVPIAQMQASPPVQNVEGAPAAAAPAASAGTDGWYCEDLTDEEVQWIEWGAHGSPPGWSPWGVYDYLVASLGPAGGAGGADGSGLARFGYKSGPIAELRFCPRQPQTITGVRFPRVTITHGSGLDAGIPWLGSGTGSIYLEFLRLIGRGDYGRYAAVSDIDFDEPIGGHVGGVVGAHFVKVDCATGVVEGGGIGTLTP